MIFWLDHVHECVQLLFESSLWCFCCLFCFPDPHSPCLMCQKPKWVPRVFRRQMWVLSDSFSFWSSSSFQQTWCQITLEHELAEVSSAPLSVSVHVSSSLFDFCVRRDCGVCFLTARWMCDARTPLLGRIQMGFCSVRELQPRQIERGSLCPSANSWYVPREAALLFGSHRLIGKLFC